MARSAVDLAEELHGWATEEMHIRPQGRHVNAPLPSSQQLQTICRGHQIQEVWKFVLERVRSTQTVKTVQGNLLLKNRPTSDVYKVEYKGNQRYSQGRADLLAERKSLVSQLAVEKTAVGYTEHEVERLRNEVSATAEAYAAARDATRAVDRKCTLLTAYSVQVDEDAKRLNEYAMRMRTKADALTKHNDEKQLYTRGGEHHAELETACTRAVRESCGVIANFLRSLLHGRYTSDKTLMFQEKENLWQSIESKMAPYTSGEVVRSLELLTEMSALDLREKTVKIDILRDAEKLKFAYEDGRLQDTTAPGPGTLVHTVRHLVTERQGVFLQRFLQTEKCRNETWQLSNDLTSVMQRMEDALRSTCSGDTGAMQLAKALFETEVEIAAARTALSVLDAAVDRLLLEIDEARKERDALYGKFKRIQVFKELVESKQNLIRVLVRQNVSARQRLELQQEEIVQYVDSALGDHVARATSLSQQLEDGVSSEVQAFALLSLPFLMYALLDSGLRLTVLDLSIHRLTVRLQPGTSEGPQTADQRSVLQRVLTALEFAPHKAPEQLLPKVLQLQQLVDDLEGTLAGQDEVIRDMEGKDASGPRPAPGDPVNWDSFRDVCEEVRSHDDRQVATLVPALRRGLTEATQALSDCLRLRDTATNWWEQPAQNAATWMVVDDENLQQWRDKWTLAVTRLRQIQMSMS